MELVDIEAISGAIILRIDTNNIQQTLEVARSLFGKANVGVDKWGLVCVDLGEVFSGNPEGAYEEISARVSDRIFWATCAPSNTLPPI